MKYRLLFCFPLADIKNLIENYVDIRMQSIEMIESVKTCERVQDVEYGDIPPDTCPVIPVSLPKKNGTVFAKVSPDDYATIMSASNKWRLCYSGYPIFVKRKNDTFTTTYMHKLIHGGSAKHINGDRLDNRRENLMDSPRGPPAPRKRKNEERDDVSSSSQGTEPGDEIERAIQDIKLENEWRAYYGECSDEDFKISTPKFLTPETCSFRYNDQDLKLYKGFASIRYPRNKVYKGDVFNGMPHGYGHLYEEEHNIESCGMWRNGLMYRGMVLNFKETSRCECFESTICPLREVTRVDVVESGHRR